MNIQIFGKSKCFDTKKAQRYFKERGIKYQEIDLIRYGMSEGEIKSVYRSVGLEALVDPKHPDVAELKYVGDEIDKLEKLYMEPKRMATPIARNGKVATVGYCPDVWKEWK